ncbi:hypothetical protein JYG23_01175 [Sedimentibacter sp. zth1]|uniref:hypothetical protein n=1 Tax=Sedimentibacter sp. zth1 TaxID=2816908 RepID=UPI001A911BCC|nr:hypothetical protein [Sedimentibacter sp. zth1]QSX06108.1 hypothetical protein JYG23_01175 [Sedimentibacter sp. zth1]
MADIQFDMMTAELEEGAPYDKVFVNKFAKEAMKISNNISLTYYVNTKMCII